MCRQLAARLRLISMCPLSAYRDLQKTDKTKKSSSKGKAKEADFASVSNSASTGPKGKQSDRQGFSPTEAPQPPPSSDPGDGDETEDDVGVIRAPSEDEDGEAPEADEDEEVEEEEDEDEEAVEEVESEDEMEVEDQGLSQEAKKLAGEALESQDQDAEMDT